MLPPMLPRLAELQGNSSQYEVPYRAYLPTRTRVCATTASMVVYPADADAEAVQKTRYGVRG